MSGNAHESKRRHLVAAMVGSIVEWYDFALYAAASALVFAHVFFDPEHVEASAIASFLTFAAGFLARPLGGIFFGHFGDRLGRKPMLVITLILMGVSTTCIGLLPTRESVGPIAALLLVMLRCMQGLGAGAEYAGAMLVASESSQVGKRGSAGVWPASGCWMGSLIAVILLATISSSMSREAFLDYGWRIPFLLSILIVGVGFWVRIGVAETREFVERKKEETATNRVRFPLGEVLRSHKKLVLIAMGSNTILSAYSYVLQVFALRYMTVQLNLSSAQALMLTTIAYAIGISSLPLWGLLTDRYGARAVSIWCALFCTIYTVPFFLVINSGSLVIAALGLIIGFSCCLCPVFAAQTAFFTELFPVHIRFSGIAFAREVSMGFLGGPAPAVATVLVSMNGGNWHYLAGVMSLCAFIAFCSYFVSKTYLKH